MKHTKKYICSSSSNDQQFEYMLLDRLRTDCNYFLKHPHEKHLWAGSIDGQIEKMKELYDTLKIKPEWLSMEDINRYEKEMKAAASDKEVTAARSVRTYRVKGSKSIKADRQSDILIIRSHIKDNLVLDNYMGTGTSNYNDYQIELFHDSDGYGGYPWWYIISKDGKTLRKVCYDEDLSNTLYRVAQFIYNKESESIKESLNADTQLKFDEPLKESIDGWDERTGVILRIAKYLNENPDADPPEGYIDPQGREISSYIARYGDYATTPFSRIKTRDLQDYARDHSLISPSPDILSTDEFLRKFHHLKSKKSPRSYSKWEKLVDIFNGQGLSVFDDWGILIKDDVELGNRYERLTDDAQENISKLLAKEAVKGSLEERAEDLNRYEFLVKRYGHEEDREAVTAISLEDAEDQLNSDGYIEYWDYLPDFNYDIEESYSGEESLVEGSESINDRRLKVFTFSSTENVPFAHYVRWFVYADSEDSAREMIDTYLSINKFNFSDFRGGRQITKKEMKRMIDRGVNYIELTPDNFMNKEEIRDLHHPKR